MEDLKTAEAFATSFNNLPPGSVYSKEQFEDWLAPITKKDITGKEVLELGCGGGNLLVHFADWNPSKLVGVELGSSIISARRNLENSNFKKWEIVQDDLTKYENKNFDFVYCIGVLHHLKSPKKGFDSVIKNVKYGGKFHCWVYAREGNLLVPIFVEPLRKIFCRFPWQITKYLVATPLSIPVYIYSKFLSVFKGIKLILKLPLAQYCLWLSKRDWLFTRHVVFDQLVTPQTTYISRETIEEWLTDDKIQDKSTYIIFRNGNSWKFGGKIKD